MALKVYEEDNIRAVAERIREKTGTETTYTTAEMPNGIDEVYNKGFDDSLASIEPLNTELQNTLAGVDTGGKSYYDEFWDAYQDYGKRTDHKDAFGGVGWTELNFKPKYDINIVGNGTRLFDGNKSIRDLKAILDRCGVVIDTSKATNLSYLLTSSNIETFGVLDTTSLTKLTDILYYCPKLKSVEKVILKGDGSQSFASAFSELGSLEHIVFEGVIGQNGFNVRWSTKLSKASIESIINALSSTTSGLSVTLSKTAKEAAFTDAEWTNLIATKPNWTINLI